MNSKNDITLDDLKSKYTDFYNVGDLLDFIYEHKLPRDSKILVQRIPDSYYIGHNGDGTDGWQTMKKQEENYYHALKWNKRIDSGELLDKLDHTKLHKYTDEELLELRDEYSPIFCPVKFADDENLYLNLHY